MAASEAGNRVEPANMLRIMAWLLVFQTHALMFAPDGIRSPIVVRGFDVSWALLLPAWPGVWTFFILSGYLIGKGFYAGRYRSEGPRDFARFWWGRFVRVAPLYYASTLVVAAVLYSDTFRPANLGRLVPILTFTYDGKGALPAIGATWFISTVVQLYALTPLFHRVVRSRLRDRRFVALAILGLLAAGLLIRHLPGLLDPAAPGAAGYPALMSQWRFIYKPVWANADLFFVGFLLNTFTEGRKNAMPVALRTVAGATLGVLVIASAYFADYGFLHHVPALFSAFAFGFPSVYLAVVGFVLFAFDAGRNERLSLDAVRRNPWRALEAPSVLTFGMFVWHSAVFTRLGPLIDAGGVYSTYLVRTAVVLVVSVALSVVSYHAIEVPFLRLRAGSPPTDGGTDADADAAAAA